MYFLIGADIVPTESNVKSFCSGNMSQIISDDLATLLNAASYRIFNLEVPLTDNLKPIAKCGPNLCAPSTSINGYKTIGVDLLSLANNHILDQGEQGFKSTTTLLKNNGINTVGGGDTLAKAAEPFVFLFGNKRIGIYACCEHEFSYASDVSPGANPYDSLCSFDAVEELKRIVDYVIILYHGGKEHYRYPSPLLQRICRKFVEKGADLVLCQHSHCIGCEELYAGATIVYGQGNFLFVMSDSEYWKTSLLVKIDDQLQLSYIPLKKVNNGVSVASSDECDRIMLDFHKRSIELHENPELIMSKYDEYALKMVDYYLDSFKGKEGLLFKFFNKLSGNRLRSYEIKKKYTQNEILRLLNYVSCEAHSELLVRGMELKVNE